jgi:hypothetical protein
VRKNEPRCAIHALGPTCSTAAPTAKMPEGMPMRMVSRFVAPGASASATSVPAMRAATPVQLPLTASLCTL